METTIVCKECGRELSIGNFSYGRWGRLAVCKECCAKRRKEKKAKKAKDRDEERRTLRLCDFTPRELMERLRKLGYTGKLTYTETHVIDLENL